MESKPFAQLSTRERGQFWQIHAAFYEATPKGFQKSHADNYLKMLEEDDQALAYFVSARGKELACALVFPKARRWYSFAVHPARLVSLGLGSAARKKLVARIVAKLSECVLAKVPRAWGTVDARNQQRIRLFAEGKFGLAKKREEVWKAFGRGHAKGLFEFRHGVGGRLEYSRKNSVNGPGYWQVLLLPKGGKK